MNPPTRAQLRRFVEMLIRCADGVDEAQARAAKLEAALPCFPAKLEHACRVVTTSQSSRFILDLTELGPPRHPVILPSAVFRDDELNGVLDGELLEAFCTGEWPPGATRRRDQSAVDGLHALRLARRLLSAARSPTPLPAATRRRIIKLLAELLLAIHRVPRFRGASVRQPDAVRAARYRERIRRTSGWIGTVKLTPDAHQAATKALEQAKNEGRTLSLSDVICDRLLGK